MLPLLLLSSFAAPGAKDCGLGSAAVPDFTLTDVNPNSPGYGRAVVRDDLLGQVMVIYWAVST